MPLSMAAFTRSLAADEASNASMIVLKCGNCPVMSKGIHPSMLELPQQVTITATGTFSDF